MSASSRWQHRLSAHPVLGDLVVAVVILWINLAQPGDHRDDQPIELNLTCALVIFFASGTLLLRRRYPLLVLALTATGVAGYLYLTGVKSPIGITVAAATYTVIVQSDRLRRKIACAAVLAVAAALVAATIAFTDGDLLTDLGVAVLILLAVAIGEAVRYRRAYRAELEERVRRAEQSREEDAQRRVIEERLRIAHELHDVIAHHIAMMNVQAGVASHLLREEPAAADQALGLVRTSGRTVLDELSLLLGVLRRSGDTSLPMAPAPSLRRLGPLIESFAIAGLTVDWQPSPAADGLADIVDLTAYRILQESLTNVVKHAPGAVVRVRLDRHAGPRGDNLAVEVTDDGGTTERPAVSAGPGTGHGLLGMQERVASVGGRLDAGPLPGGGFRVRAVLPLPPDQTPSPTAGALRAGAAAGTGAGAAAGRSMPSEEGVNRDDPGPAGGRPDPHPQRLPGACRLGLRPAGGG